MTVQTSVPHPLNKSGSSESRALSVTAVVCTILFHDEVGGGTAGMRRNKAQHLCKQAGEPLLVNDNR